MQIVRPLALSPLIVLSTLLIAPLTAQTSNHRSALSSSFTPVSPDTQTTSDIFHLLAPLDLSGISLSPKIPAAENKSDPQRLISKEEAIRQTLELEANQPTCYTLRTYRVTRESPDSDSTEPAGYTTCEPSSRFKVKTAVQTQHVSTES